jgi:hypothetical protein
MIKDEITLRHNQNQINITEEQIEEAINHIIAERFL